MTDILEQAREIVAEITGCKPDQCVWPDYRCACHKGAAAILALAEPKWREIESAPKDGTQFWGSVGDDAIAMFWHPGFSEFVSSYSRMTLAPGITFDDGSTTRDHDPVIHKPKRWMSTLPLPPKEEQ